MHKHISGLASADPVASCLERLGSIRSKPAHTVLFERGDAADGVYVVISGKVALTLGVNLSCALNRTAVAGDIVGLPAAVSGEPYSLTATTITPCELLHVAREDILAALKDDPQFGFALLEMLGHEVHQLREVWRDGHDSATSPRHERTRARRSPEAQRKRTQ